MSDSSGVGELAPKDWHQIALAVDLANNEAKHRLDQLRRTYLDAPNGTVHFKPQRRAAQAIRVAGVRYAADAPTEDAREQLSRSITAWVAGCAHSNLPFTFALQSNQGDVGLWMGGGSSASDGIARLQGAFPGVRFAEQVVRQQAFATEFAHSAFVTGIPSVTLEKETVGVSMDALIRGMRGERFAVVVNAQPLSKEEIHAAIDQVLKQRSENWETIHRTVTEQVGESTARSLGWSSGSTAGESMFNAGALRRLGRSIWAGALGYGKALSGNLALSSFASLDASVTQTSSWSRSRGLERLDAFAEAYDALLQEFHDRYDQGLAEGMWKTSCRVYAESEEALRRAASLWSHQINEDAPAFETFRQIRVPGFAATKTGWPILEHDGRAATPLTSELTSRELSRLVAIPTEEHAGFDVRRVPRFAVDVRRPSANGISLGHVLDRDAPLPDQPVTIPENELAKHTLVAGITGGGKTTTIKSILRSLKTPFLVIEPAKAEYRHLRIRGNPVVTFTAGDERTTPLRINPFEVPRGGALLAHVDALTALINASFPMEGPMFALVEQGVLRAYTSRGWDIEAGVHPEIGPDESPNDFQEVFPTLDEFYRCVADLVDDQGYAGDYGANIRGALLTRIRSLCTGSRGLLFNSRESFDVGKLVSQPTVIEMKDLGDEGKAMLMGLLLLRLYKHFESEAARGAASSELRHLLVIEEAHRLFQRVSDKEGSLTTSNAKYRAVQTFERILAEARAYGLGITIANQLPLQLSKGAIKNTNSKIIHRLASREDALEVGGALGLDEEDSQFLTTLRVGEALYYRASLIRPAHIKVVPQSASEEGYVDDETLRKRGITEGFAVESAFPPNFALFKSIVQKGVPGALLDVGDALLFTILLANIDRLERAGHAAIARLDQVAKSLGSKFDLLMLQALVVEALRNTSLSRGYVCESVRRRTAIARCSAKVLTIRGQELAWDYDAVLDFRRLIEAANKPDFSQLPAVARCDEAPARKFAREALNHANSLRLVGNDKPSEVSRTFELANSAVQERLVVTDTDERVRNYTQVLTGALMSNQMAVDEFARAFDSCWRERHG